MAVCIENSHLVFNSRLNTVGETNHGLTTLSVPEGSQIAR